LRYSNDIFQPQYSSKFLIRLILRIRLLESKNLILGITLWFLNSDSWFLDSDPDSWNHALVLRFWFLILLILILSSDFGFTVKWFQHWNHWFWVLWYDFNIETIDSESYDIKMSMISRMITFPIYGFLLLSLIAKLDSRLQSTDSWRMGWLQNLIEVWLLFQSTSSCFCD
jgi:hypothetical protein